MPGMRLPSQYPARMMPVVQTNPPRTCDTVNVRVGTAEHPGHRVHHGAHDRDEPGQHDRLRRAVPVDGLLRPGHPAVQGRPGRPGQQSGAQPFADDDTRAGRRSARPPRRRRAAGRAATAQGPGDAASSPAVNSSESPGQEEADQQTGLGDQHDEDADQSGRRDDARRIERVHPAARGGVSTMHMDGLLIVGGSPSRADSTIYY